MISFILMFLPFFLKRFILNMIPGNQISKNVKIGFSYIKKIIPQYTNQSCAQYKYNGQSKIEANGASKIFVAPLVEIFIVWEREKRKEIKREECVL